MQYKTGIIGYGHMGREYHNKTVARLTDCVQIAAMYDIREERRILGKEDGLRVYDTLEGILSDTDLDIIVIATPNHVHKQLSIAALKAGKHVICEKPVTMNANELDEIIKVSRETGKQFAVHQNRRWDGSFRKIKHTIEDGLIGDPFYIKHRIHGAGGGAIYGWRSDVANGGGFLMDWGIHLLDRTIWLMEPHKIVEISASVHRIRSMADDNAIVNIRFDNNTRLLMECMQYAVLSEPMWLVHGTRGAIKIDSEDDTEGTLRVSTITGEHYEENLVYREAGPEIIKSRVLDEKFDVIPSFDPRNSRDSKAGNDWACYYENYTAALDGREELIVKPEQSLRLMKVIDAIYQSSKELRAISCNL